MIPRKTVLVLGAGASVAVGYPTGEELAEALIAIERIKGPAYNNALSAGFRPSEIQEFTKLLHRSNDTIDRLLQENHEFRAVGKFLMVQYLISLEHQDELMERGRKCWYKTFRRVLAPNLDSLSNSHVKIVTFNYDRSLEEFLYQTFYSLGGKNRPTELSEGLRNLGFHHMHGMVSPLPWQGRSNESRRYGTAPSLDEISDVGQHIALAGDQMEQAAVQQTIATTRRLVILGFGFDQSNISKLGLDRYVPTDEFDRQIYATSIGLSAHRQSELKERYNIVFFSDIDALFNGLNFEAI